MTGDPDAKMPKDLSLIEQYLLLLESSDELSEFISNDRAHANVSIRANNNGSERLLAIASRAESWWKEHGPPEVSARATGIMFEFARAEREITTGQIAGLSLDLCALFCLFLLLFRKLAVTVIAMAPTFATIVITFGLLGWSGAALDAGTVFVGTLAVGVTVDETVHMVNAYTRAALNSPDSGGALEASLRKILPPLLMTTSALSAGFLVLGVSSFAFTRQLGLATGIAMLLCAFANATLLPSLLAVSFRNRAT
jgi:predicted RND superfamily exporter protein